MHIHLVMGRRDFLCAQKHLQEVLCRCFENNSFSVSFLHRIQSVTFSVCSFSVYVTGVPVSFFFENTVQKIHMEVGQDGDPEQLAWRASCLE